MNSWGTRGNPRSTRSERGPAADCRGAPDAGARPETATGESRRGRRRPSRTISPRFLPAPRSADRTAPRPTATSCGGAGSARSTWSVRTRAAIGSWTKLERAGLPTNRQRAQHRRRIRPAGRPPFAAGRVANPCGAVGARLARRIGGPDGPDPFRTDESGRAPPFEPPHPSPPVGRTRAPNRANGERVSANATTNGGIGDRRTGDRRTGDRRTKSGEAGRNMPGFLPGVPPETGAPNAA